MTFDPGFFDHELDALADTTAATAIALTGRFARRGAGGGRLRWAHWNYAGHREVAAALVEGAASDGPPESSRGGKIPVDGLAQPRVYSAAPQRIRPDFNSDRIPLEQRPHGPVRTIFENSDSVRELKLISI